MMVNGLTLDKKGFENDRERLLDAIAKGNEDVYKRQAPIYADKYDELGLGRNMLSRSLEDAGTLWAVMFPWTGCGAYQTGVCLLYTSRCV